jgi:hypothetical protein
LLASGQASGCKWNLISYLIKHDYKWYKTQLNKLWQVSLVYSLLIKIRIPIFCSMFALTHYNERCILYYSTVLPYTGLLMSYSTSISSMHACGSTLELFNGTCSTLCRTRNFTIYCNRPYIWCSRTHDCVRIRTMNEYMYILHCSIDYLCVEYL